MLTPEARRRAAALLGVPEDHPAVADQLGAALEAGLSLLEEIHRRPPRLALVPSAVKRDAAS